MIFMGLSTAQYTSLAILLAIAAGCALRARRGQTLVEALS